MNEKGYIRICKREKNIIIRNRENIPMIKIESTMYKIPQITKVTIITIPDLRITKQTYAFITLHPNTHLTPTNMRKHLTTENISKHF